jgi:hypothetical protein
VSGFALAQAARLTVFADALSAAAAQRITELVESTLAEREACPIALAGGDTPRRCYNLLRGIPLPWPRIHFYFGDERCLPVGDPQRNDTMARGSLLQSAYAANIHAILAELGPAVAAARYARELANADALDLVLLGLGEDGHTASLFPGAAQTVPGRGQRQTRCGAGAGAGRHDPGHQRQDFLGKLNAPRVVWLMLPAAVVDASIAELTPLLNADDIVIDGGNSYYKDDIARAKRLPRNPSAMWMSASAAAPGDWNAATA